MEPERKRPREGAVIVQSGAGSRSRTHDLRFTKPLLYQLSYAGPALREARYFTTCRCFGRVRGLPFGDVLSLTAAGAGAVAASSEATGSVGTVKAKP